MRNLCDVATLPFQAHANQGTWSIDFGCIKSIILKVNHGLVYVTCYPADTELFGTYPPKNYHKASGNIILELQYICL